MQNCYRFEDHFGSLANLGKLKSDAVATSEELFARYPLVFCHMDTQNCNMVYNSKTGELILVSTCSY